MYLHRLCSRVCVVAYFFLMIRRPPRSTRTDTLFPYTTLFRSICCYCIVQKNFTPRIGAKECTWTSRSEEHTSELQSLMRISYAVLCLEQNKIQTTSADITNFQENKTEHPFIIISSIEANTKTKSNTQHRPLRKNPNNPHV